MTTSSPEKRATRLPAPPLPHLVAISLTALSLLGFQRAHAEGPATSTGGDPVVWGALVFAGPEGFPYGGELPENFPALVDTLKARFESPHFSLLNHHSQSVAHDHESWVIPAKKLFLKIESIATTADGSGLELHLQTWHGKRLLQKADVTLRPGVPLILPGPDWEDGQLILVLKLR